MRVHVRVLQHNLAVVEELQVQVEALPYELLQRRAVQRRAAQPSRSFGHKCSNPVVSHDLSGAYRHARRDRQQWRMFHRKRSRARRRSAQLSRAQPSPAEPSRAEPSRAEPGTT